jgi:predicted transcriptional regulator with HTH domain
MKTSTRRVLFVSFLSLLLVMVPTLRAQGHFELSGHYGWWTLNILGSLGARITNDATKSELKKRILSDIQSIYPTLSEQAYNQSSQFDSHGQNFGFGVRYYPSRNGSFSLGLSIEKSNFKVLPTMTSHMALEDMSTGAAATFDGTATGTALVKAMSFLLTVRWDIFPSAFIHPYITFGGGVTTSKALDDSTLSYSYSGQLSGSSITTQTIGSSETKTLEQLKEESSSKFPNFLPFLELNLGLKVMITRNIHFLVDAGVFDGFLVSGGLAVRL